MLCYTWHCFTITLHNTIKPKPHKTSLHNTYTFTVLNLTVQYLHFTILCHTVPRLNYPTLCTTTTPLHSFQPCYHDTMLFGTPTWPHDTSQYQTCTIWNVTLPAPDFTLLLHTITDVIDNTTVHPNFTYTRLDKTIPIQYIPILTFTILNRPKPYSPLPTQNLLLLHSTSPYLTLLYHYIVIHRHHGTKLNMTIPLPCFSTQQYQCITLYCLHYYSTSPDSTLRYSTLPWLHITIPLLTSP